MVLHGLLQYALKTANEAPYRIVLAQSRAGGFTIWRMLPGGAESVANFNRKEDAADWIFSQVAVMGEIV